MNWISVKDGLPKNENNNGDSFNYVLVGGEKDDRWVMCFATHGCNEWTIKSDYGAFSDCGWPPLTPIEVTHWMPLPKPPKSPQRVKDEQEMIKNMTDLGLQNVSLLNFSMATRKEPNELD